jgi:hypothetical protein
MTIIDRLTALVAQALPGRLASQEWENAKSYLSTVALWTVKFWAVVFVGAAWCIGLLVTSCLTYVLFYHWMIPTHSTSIPLHFDFSTTLVPPHATVHLHGEKQQWRYTELTEVHADLAMEQARSRYFSPGHQYNAYLDLSFPDSPANQEIGMISVEMLAMSNTTLLASSLQSFLPQYTSPLVRWMYSWSFALPLVFGLLQEKQTVSLHMFDQLQESESFPISHFRVHLKNPQGAWKFQLYNGVLRLQVHLFGLRWFMYHWPLSTAAVLGGLIFSVQAFWSAVFLLFACLMCCSGGGGAAGEATGENGEFQQEEDQLHSQHCSPQHHQSRPPPEYRGFTSASIYSQHHQKQQQQQQSYAASTAGTTSLEGFTSSSVGESLRDIDPTMHRFADAEEDSPSLGEEEDGGSSSSSSEPSAADDRPAGAITRDPALRQRHRTPTSNRTDAIPPAASTRYDQSRPSPAAAVSSAKSLKQLSRGLLLQQARAAASETLAAIPPALIAHAVAEPADQDDADSVQVEAEEAEPAHSHRS